MPGTLLPETYPREPVTVLEYVLSIGLLGTVIDVLLGQKHE
jgi:hypothetical protein